MCYDNSLRSGVTEAACRQGRADKGRGVATPRVVRGVSG